jgi:hypothetical protein
MSIKFLPLEIIKKYAPDKKVAKLLGDKPPFKVKRALLSSFTKNDFIDTKAVTETVLKASKFYKDKFKDMPEEMSTTKAIEETLNDKALLINRVQNTVVTQISQNIRENYTGEWYIWGPSSAEIPDPIHQLNYGKKFQIGDGEQPGDRFGCQCMMEILTADDKLDING